MVVLQVWGDHAMLRRRILFYLALLTLLSGPPAIAQDDTRIHMQDLTLEPAIEAERRTLHAAYQECAAAALTEFLGAADAALCSEIFLRLKLTFLPGTTLETFLTRSAATRAKGNQMGYAAYLAWLVRETRQASID